jgi:glycosyltransferase involved in cell wall biosynthesis
MRILTVCTSWRIFGAETITLKMLEGFKRAGHSQVAVTTIWSDGEFSRRLEKMRVKEVQMPFGTLVTSFRPRYVMWTANCLIRLPVLWRKWLHLTRKFQPDVILFTGSKQPLLVLPFLRKVPGFLIEHSNVTPDRDMRWLYGRLAKRLVGFITVSEFMRRNLSLVGIPSDQIRVIKNGAVFSEEFTRITPGSMSIGTDPEKPTRVGIVGQISPNKGHDCLLESLRLLRSQGANVVVETFGDGDHGYKTGLDSKLTELRLAGAWRWNGYERDKDRIFGNIDICVVPSLFGDPFPTVAIEAAAYGLPVVASRIGGLPEIVEDGVTGWLVAPNSPIELATRVRHLIENPEQAQKMGDAGRERVRENFIVERMVSEYERLLRQSLR